MKRNDPNHGTQYGYQLGCRNECCRNAHNEHISAWRRSGSEGDVVLRGGAWVPRGGIQVWEAS